MDSEEAPKSSKKDDGNVRVPRAKRRRHQPIKVSNQIPTSRRKEIEKALEDPSSTPKTWSRLVGGNHIELVEACKNPEQFDKLNMT
ncbi:MAG: hypothetical protein Ct9H90mP14_1300 [Methanobacteriota archaeon]|nr:MAG: hypothetical protein Ct9H90mP14_1300 [Euryarchaeota archaeon]